MRSKPYQCETRTGPAKVMTDLTGNEALESTCSRKGISRMTSNVVLVVDIANANIYPICFS